MPDLNNALRRKLSWPVSVAVIGIALLAIYLGPLRSHLNQQHNLKMARESANILRPKLEAESRYAAITVGGYTGEGGCLFVLGFVTSEKDLIDLKTMVASVHPQVMVKRNVDVK